MSGASVRLVKTLPHILDRQQRSKQSGDSLKPLCCRDPALPALCGYPLSAIFCYAEKMCMCVPHLLAGGVTPRGYAVRTKSLYFSAFQSNSVIIITVEPLNNGHIRTYIIQRYLHREVN